MYKSTPKTLPLIWCIKFDLYGSIYGFETWILTQLLLFLQDVVAAAVSAEKLMQEIEALQETVASLKSLDERRADEIHRLEEEVSHLKNAHEGTQVMFHARLSSNKEYPTGTTITFDEVVTNLGGQYAPGVGVFQCPVDGYYVFSVSFHSYRNRSRGAIMKAAAMPQDRPLTSVDSGGPSGVHSSTAYACCRASETVFVRALEYTNQYVAANLYGSQSTFSGFLLYEATC